MAPIEKVKAALEDTARFLDGLPVDNPRTQEAKQFAAELKQTLAELEGKVIVPIEPTEEMVFAGEDCPIVDYDGQDVKQVYKAMIAPYLPKGDE